MVGRRAGDRLMPLTTYRQTLTDDLTLARLQVCLASSWDYLAVGVRYESGVIH